jgi:hypothetical protein
MGADSVLPGAVSRESSRFFVVVIPQRDADGSCSPAGIATGDTINTIIIAYTNRALIAPLLISAGG